MREKILNDLVTTIKNQDKETVFKTLYEVTDEKYTLYWSKK